VVLEVTVTADGRVIDPVVIKGPGLGLEEKAMEKVRTWKMRAAPGPGGKLVACRAQIEVNFHLVLDDWRVSRAAPFTQQLHRQLLAR
jgi:TonB family protein